MTFIFCLQVWTICLVQQFMTDICNLLQTCVNSIFRAGLMWIKMLLNDCISSSGLSVCQQHLLARGRVESWHDVPPPGIGGVRFRSIVNRATKEAMYVPSLLAERGVGHGNYWQIQRQVFVSDNHKDSSTSMLSDNICFVISCSRVASKCELCSLQIRELSVLYCLS